MDFPSTKYFFFLFIAATLVYIIGLFVPVMDIDAGQYASISQEMLHNKSYLEVSDRGRDYLDKPPLLFWLSVISFKIFGVSTFAYKLPSFLFTLLGVYSTFKLAEFLYNREVALVASLFLYTSQAFFLFNNDVRTDNLLTSLVIFSSWQLILYTEKGKWLTLFTGFGGVAFAMMAKGPIGAVVPASALFFHIMMKREWKKIFRWQWIIGILFSLLLLLPMVIGLYNQFGREGPVFFFWTQSFGRITGENKWDNDQGYFYFTREILWSFLPWTLIVVPAIVYSLFKIFRTRFSKSPLQEYYTIGGFVLPFVALSFSHYKLPHYIFVLYPLGAIISAVFLMSRVAKSKSLSRTFGFLQLIPITGMFMVVLIICIKWFPVTNLLLWLCFGCGSALVIFWCLKPLSPFSRILLPPALTAILVNLMLNAHAYPALLKYQSGSELAEKAVENAVPKNRIYFSNYGDYSFVFYFGSNVPQISPEEIIVKTEEGDSFWVVGDEGILEYIRSNHVGVKKLFVVGDFHITTLTSEFLNPETRPGTLKKVYLMQL